MADKEALQYRWAIDEMYPDEAAIKKDEEILKQKTAELSTLAEDPKKNLKAILALYHATNTVAENLIVYTHMKQDEDSRNSDAQRKYQQASRLLQDYDAAFSFFEPYLLSLSEEEQKALMEDPELALYHEMFARIFRYKEHTLSAEEEALLAKMQFLSEAPSDIYYFLTNADMKFLKLKSLDGAELTAENFTTHEKNPDVAVRKEAFESLYETFRSFGNTISTSYTNNVKALTTQAKLRHYNSAIEMELFADNVPVAVYDSLLDSVHRHFSYLHRYYAKKKELLGLKEQHMYDVYLPLLKGTARRYTFEEARDLCIASVAPLGKEYQDIYRKAFDERWMDVYPREGKAGGAYSSGSYESRPYILLNFNGTLDSVFTLAHEMGHSMHSYFAKHENDSLYYNYTIFVAEVASTFNELLLLDYLRKQAKTPEEKLELLDHHLDSFKSTLYRQTMFAEFEKIVHDRIEKGESLACEDFDAIYGDLNRRYFGDAMITDEGITHEWLRIPHFYSNFYVYKYATGFTASTVLSQKVLNGGPKDVEAYFSFLKDGCHHFPIEQLKMAGCDMSDPKTVDSALEVFGKLVDELEAIKEL